MPDHSVPTARLGAEFRRSLRSPLNLMLRLILLLLFLLCSPLVFSAASPAVSEFETDTQVATSGFFRLSWQSDAEVELEELEDADGRGARLIYRGADQAYFVSGKPDGVYGYRIRVPAQSEPSPWLGPVEVEVRHHSLTRAWLFFALGAFVFLSILVLVLRRPGKGA